MMIKSHNFKHRSDACMLKGGWEGDDLQRESNVKVLNYSFFNALLAKSKAFVSLMFEFATSVIRNSLSSIKTLTHQEL